MKAMAAVLGPLASLATIISVIVRLKWAAAKQSRFPEAHAPSPGVRKAAIIWLYAVTFIVAVVVILVVLPAFLKLLV